MLFSVEYVFKRSKTYLSITINIIPFKIEPFGCGGPMYESIYDLIFGQIAKSIMTYSYTDYIPLNDR